MFCSPPPPLIFTEALILEQLKRIKPLPFVLIYNDIQFAFLFRYFFKPLHFFTVKFILWEGIYKKDIFKSAKK